MKTHEKKASELFKKGYNCAQSVIGAYAEELDLDFNTLIKLSSSFGGGMGRLREVCGAVTGMFMVAGLKKGYIEYNNDSIKHSHYDLIQNLGHQFKELNGSIICRELLNLREAESSAKPEKRTDSYYKNRPCENFIISACKILDKTLN